MKTRLAAACLAVLLPVGASAYDPDGFNECILKHVATAKTDFGAKQAVKACARKHDTGFSGEKKETK